MKDKTKEKSDWLANAVNTITSGWLSKAVKAKQKHKKRLESK